MNGEHEFIYAGRERGSPEVKIGRSFRPHGRLRALSGDRPIRAELLLRCDRQLALRTERKIHSLLRDAHIRSEWFHASPAEVERAFVTVALQECPDLVPPLPIGKNIISHGEMMEMRAEGVKWAEVLRRGRATAFPWYSDPAAMERRDRLRAEACVAVRNMIASGLSCEEIAAECDVSAATIRRMSKGQAKRDCIAYRVRKFAERRAA